VYNTNLAQPPSESLPKFPVLGILTKGDYS
jgi:hypothetical protein